VDVVALDIALHELAGFDPQQSRVVALKFFAGLTIDEIADALDISTATVEREWVIAVRCPAIVGSARRRGNPSGKETGWTLRR
jgi:hypothetical protein